MESAFGVAYMAIFCRINAMKYLWRCSHHTAGPEDNLRKALYYVKRALQYEVQLAAEDSATTWTSPRRGALGPT
eukprot:COSAG01_NODE_871_length_13024_cov_115.041925_11_plen_74_part_00